jgi:hypothetical protein
MKFTEEEIDKLHTLLFEVHHCHAEQCKTVVPEKMFMCRPHWYMLPKKMRDAVWNAYTPGQEIRKDPTQHYLDVTRECIEYVANREGQR